MIPVYRTLNRGLSCWNEFMQVLVATFWTVAAAAVAFLGLLALLRLISHP